MPLELECLSFCGKYLINHLYFVTQMWCLRHIDSPPWTLSSHVGHFFFCEAKWGGVGSCPRSTNTRHLFLNFMLSTFSITSWAQSAQSLSNHSKEKNCFDKLLHTDLTAELSKSYPISLFSWFEGYLHNRYKAICWPILDVQPTHISYLSEPKLSSFDSTR